MFRPFRSVVSACAEALLQLAACALPLASALRRLLDHASVLAEMWSHPVAKLVTDVLLDKGVRLTVLVLFSLARARVQAWYARLWRRN